MWWDIVAGCGGCIATLTWMPSRVVLTPRRGNEPVRGIFLFERYLLAT